MSFSDFFSRMSSFFLILIVLLPIHLLLRIVYFFWNNSLFQKQKIADDFWYIFKYGIQADLISIMVLNLPLFFLLLICSNHDERKNQVVRKTLLGFAIVVNGLGLLVNLFDTGYFLFSHQRSTVSLLFVVIDSMSSLTSIVAGYWPLFLWFIFFMIGISYVLQMFFSSLFKVYLRRHDKNWNRIFGVVIIGGVIFSVSISRSFSPSTPLLKVHPENLPLAQNTVHTLLFSMIRGQNTLTGKNYFSETTVDIIKPVCTRLNSSDSFIYRNVVFFILESFSKDFFDADNPRRANTPFFDSLISKSVYYQNTFSNSFGSSHGIVSILAGLPPFIDEPFYYSTYANTKMEGVGTIFKKQGYSTSFFMGAGEDHFGFGRFCKMVGIDNYYGQKEFNNDAEYDGNWGIYDEPFLQYGITELDKLNKPFFSVFFTISSHPPFTIPARYRSRFDYPGQSSPQKSIGYVDLAFRHFFENARNKEWFNNTLFIFCADHWLAPDDKTPWSYVKSSAIPLFIFDPLNPLGRVETTVAGQVDVVPTVLNKLNYSGIYTGFGRSLMDSVGVERYVVNRMNYIHQLIDSEFVLGYNEPAEKVEYFYNYKNDPSLRTNLVNDPTYVQQRQKLDTILRANIQQYNNSLISRNFCNN